MSVFQVVTTPTHRYFARKRKDDIILRIEEMRRALGRSGFSLAEFNERRELSRDELAREAMALVREFPE